MTVLVLAILILDITTFFVIVPAGILAAIAFYTATHNKIHIPPNYQIALTGYLSIIIFGALFSHRKEKSQQEKIETIRSIGSSIAHELRTPLASIRLSAEVLKEYLPELLNAYDFYKSRKEQTTDAEMMISATQQNKLANVADNIEAESEFANTMIDIFLTKANQNELQLKEFSLCSAKQCIRETLKRYPFLPEDTDIVKLCEACEDSTENKIDDFLFRGNELLTIHILFNLIKNALYYLKAANKPNPEIRIWLEENKKHHSLHFYDNGAGISPEILPRIFERFFSHTPHGSGIGLAFCQMVMRIYGGEVRARSEEGKYTEIILIFPKIQ